MRKTAFYHLLLVFLVFGIAGAALASGLSATVHKRSATVYSKPDFKAPAVATLARKDPVTINDQLGLWYQVALSGDRSGYIRVNEVRLAASGATGSEDTMHILMTGKSGSGRVTETAGVRGLDESELRSASFDARQLREMEGNRASTASAERYAQQHHWSRTSVPWAGEPAPDHGNVSQADAREGSSATRSLLRKVGRGMLGSMLHVGEKAIPKSEEELSDEELALGPLIAGRVLGARPLWDNAGAQHRVNVIGRWLASQTSRPELPWTFGVIDSPEYNAFAAPGGYILVTRGLYQLVGNDQELAGVLAHEITHVVQRDHYEVIRKQQTMSGAKELISSRVHTGGGLAGSLARDYVEKNGASILLTSLDRDAEYRADEFAEVYLARSGMNPLALYAILQKMLAMGSASGGLAELYKTHPSLDDRLDQIDQRAYGTLQPYLRRSVADL
ncbi:MAG: M48 family metalloprotease [Rhodanobacteraceae bacterium]